MNYVFSIIFKIYNILRYIKKKRRDKIEISFFNNITYKDVPFSFYIVVHNLRVI